jgi:hypothetical protein
MQYLSSIRLRKEDFMLAFSSLDTRQKKRMQVFRPVIFPQKKLFPLFIFPICDIFIPTSLLKDAMTCK